jgi:hypothetical protein
MDNNYFSNITMNFKGLLFRTRYSMLNWPRWKKDFNVPTE